MILRKRAALERPGLRQEARSGTPAYKRPRATGAGDDLSDKSQDPPAETTGGAPEKAKAGGLLEAGATKKNRGVAGARSTKRGNKWLKRIAVLDYTVLLSILQPHSFDKRDLPRSQFENSE